MRQMKRRMRCETFTKQLLKRPMLTIVLSPNIEDHWSHIHHSTKKIMILANL